MNKDEIQALLVKILLMALGPIATKYGIDGNTTVAVATGAAAALVFFYGIYAHWNQKLAPETAIVVKANTPVPPEAVITHSNSTTVVKP